MPVVLKVLLIIVLVLLAILVVLYFVGRRMQRKRAENQTKIDQMSQNVSLLVIDKKKMKMKDAGLPKAVFEQTPKYLRRAKLPIVKAKIGPRIMTMVADESVYDLIPLKQEIRATISGIYITAVRSGRGGNLLPAPQKKKGLRARLLSRKDKAEKKLEKVSKKK